MMIKVENKRRYKGHGEYIGRPSILGNPYTIGIDGSREEVIQKYKEELLYRIKSRKKTLNTEVITEEINRLKIIEEINRLKKIATEKGDLTLVCWCSPLPCHGDVIKELLEKEIKGE